MSLRLGVGPMHAPRFVTASALFVLALVCSGGAALAATTEPETTSAQRPPCCDPPISVAVNAESAQEGDTIGPDIGTLHDADANAAAAEYVGSISWGDGTVSPASF